jgi:hypothetical protein
MYLQPGNMRRRPNITALNFVRLIISMSVGTVFAYKDVLDVREDKRVVVLNCDWMCDIHGFVELLGGSVVSE